MGLLSELYQIAAIAADTSIPAQGAFDVAIKYSAQMREKVQTHTRSSPMSNDDKFFGELLELERMWHSRSEETLSAVMRQLKVGPQAVSSQEGMATDSTKQPYCFFHGINKCLQRGCKGAKRLHVCPFCDGGRCHNREGYIEWHLNELQAPRTIVFKQDWEKMRASAMSSGSGRYQHRGRSRSPRQGPRKGGSPERRRPTGFREGKGDR